VDTLDSFHVSLCSMFFKDHLCQLVYDMCHPSDRAMCSVPYFLPCSTPWCLVTDEDSGSSPIQRSKGMKCDEGETPEAPKSGVNPHH
jgi:hypothetical protein